MGSTGIPKNKSMVQNSCFYFFGNTFIGADVCQILLLGKEPLWIMVVNTDAGEVQVFDSKTGNEPIVASSWVLLILPR